MAKFTVSELDNGFRVISAPNESLPSFTLLFSVLAGSRFEKEAEAGLAHFLEHLAFKGSRRYPDQLAIAQEIEGFGGAWNAYTTEERIGYYIKAERSNFQRAFQALADVIFYPRLREEDIDKERGVISEEYNLYRDDPKSWVEIKNQELLFEDHPLGRNILGTRKNIASLSREDFLRFRQRFFVPGRFVVGASGNFKEKEFLDLCQKYLAPLPPASSPGFPLQETATIANQKRFYFEARPTEQVNLTLSFLGKSARSEERVAVSLLTAVLGLGLSSRLFQTIRAKLSLAYTISAHHQAFSDLGGFSIYAGVTKGKTAQALKAILAELGRMRGELVPEKEIQKNKNHLRGLLALSLETNEGLISSLVSQLMIKGKIETYAELVKQLEEVKAKEVRALAREIFTPQRANLAIIGEGETKEIKAILESW